MSETLKAHPRRLTDGFYNVCKGSILDIGYAGTGGEVMPGMNVTGIDLNTPGYNGFNIGRQHWINEGSRKVRPHKWIKVYLLCGLVG